MASPDRETFYRDVYDIVSQIPEGRVLTYGHLARLAGWPQHSRMAGRAMREAPASAGLPCHRVVNAAGRTAPGWDEQSVLLQREGVRLKPCGCVDLRQCLWEIVRE